MKIKSKSAKASEIVIGKNDNALYINAQLKFKDKINSLLMNILACLISIPFVIEMNHKISLLTFINAFIFTYIFSFVFLYFLLFA